MPTHWCRVRSSARRRTRRLRPRLRVSTARCRRRRRSGARRGRTRGSASARGRPRSPPASSTSGWTSTRLSWSQIPFASPCVHSSAERSARHADLVSSVGQHANKVAGVPGRLCVEVGERLTVGLGDVKHRCGSESNESLPTTLQAVSRRIHSHCSRGSSASSRTPGTVS